MINPIHQSYVAQVATSDINKTENKENSKAKETQKVEENKASFIASQIKNGEYKIDLQATSKAIVDSLL
ncbi:flagellar biosynthesis anti-sigma factor FlgM [Campylobacter sp. IFREMER_LSEM_CL1846]|uniref:flagellar biosynthesis anti-sigma factor FlgM n=1 Tax=Campylobacter sp. IFREMER_LSEM_CL1846 TaxID=2911614 RepID=UPI0021E670DD|nr:flagellar biosynthesis anti-sigma factor FlgM [Campylobacter sp. IFREMER_LSEM_CL1846]HEC1748613.1 flagellar biosynthesis anti-sigma factor FlgM [Campylobacter lari]MCV3434011.1 flagellar biosynthesis anti-sigma factor FlgM [Campylobacter sp. IFREMER_LSEM_CL1846]HEC1769083.1 flagellar biosynthesis anti-sigma factor FlgM [Campylobacter lari]HEC1789807.1 flagellar biosynthesis anti-sigma factor FlgM [Campylobacter lari]HEC1795749.1 flagellar biosynthesis anti-sigma factor FlgM [Campylobacter l